MENARDPHKKQIISVYWVFGITLVLSLVPAVWAALASLGLGLAVLITAYILRTGQDPDSLIYNHMTFIIRTIWIGSFFAMLSMFAASFYLLQSIDNTPLAPCIDKFMRMGQTLDVLDPEGLFLAFGDCWQAYWTANLKAFIIGGVIAAGPVLFYCVVRYVRGFTRAANDYRVANPKAWF